MQRIGIFTTALVLFLLSNNLQAQTATTNIDTYETIASAFDFDNDWGFYSDQNDQLFYVDFENLKMNLSDIVVKDASGKVLRNEEVIDLPVNTIFELDFSEYGSGTYVVELKSFTGIIKKEIEIK